MTPVNGMIKNALIAKIKAFELTLFLQIVEIRGVEPLTFWLPAKRSSQLS